MADACPLCGGAVRVIAERYAGYQRGREFSLRECAECAASHAWPLTADDLVYERIYEQIRFVPGYNRYDQYAREVLRWRDPLSYLSRQEESYWAVAERLQKRRRNAHDLKVLEIGCGLGYFVFALMKDRFDVLGVDISSAAIAQATRHYGSHYAVKSLAELKSDARRYDVVIMNQLIEHVPDVHSFLADAVALLARNGEFIITTPNKSAFPGALWETDLPPVHLWWFAEDTMRYLASRHGCSVSLVDFVEYNDTHFRPKGPDIAPVRSPVLDEQGRVIERQMIRSPSLLRRFFERSHLLESLRSVRGALSGRERWRGSRGPVLAAVFRKN